MVSLHTIEKELRYGKTKTEMSVDLGFEFKDAYLIHQDLSLGGQRNVDIAVVWGSGRSDFRYTRLEFLLEISGEEADMESGRCHLKGREFVSGSCFLSWAFL